ncbi:MAG TPA: ABC transporter ATP-binding protein, partial [Acidimicrobiales bacterium]|nr:ABC transporter ATP-binding protein [Acidimicrobiales bacterium]
GLGDTVVFDGGRKVNLSPDKRFIGMVFQSYALWPHMTVRKNIAYPLKARKMRDALKGGRVEETAKLVDCQELLDRYPAQLSGGQQQRVALARGLVASPDLVLFDEPLSNLDARLRDQVRADLHELHRTKPFTAVFVTHDQSEALALGQRMAIMRSGRIEQLGAPEDVFEQPATEYVAAFIGMSNRLELTYADGGWTCAGRPVTGAALALASAGPSTVARLRPDDAQLVFHPDELGTGVSGIPVVVADVEYGGRHLDVMVDVDGTSGAEPHRVHARIPAGARDGWARRLARGDRLILAFEPTAARFFAPGGEGGAADAAPGTTVDVTEAADPAPAGVR